MENVIDNDQIKDGTSVMEGKSFVTEILVAGGADIQSSLNPEQLFQFYSLLGERDWCRTKN